MNTLANTIGKIVQLIAEIGECEELNMTLEGVVINLTNLKSALSQPKEDTNQVSELVLPGTSEDEEDNITINTLYLRKKLIQDLESNFDRPRNWFSIVLLELKQKMKTHKIQGKMYENHYVFLTHSKIKNYFDNPQSITKQKIGRFQDWNIKDFIDHPIIKHCIKPLLKPGQDAITYIEDFDNRKILLEQLSSVPLLRFLPEDLKPYMIKIRLHIGTMDLQKTKIPYLSIFNFKQWDKTTKKTSNKGLKADTTYTWNWNGTPRGWKFGGLPADSIAVLCRKNGFIEDKKKYNYGDYAEWYLKL